MGMLTLKRFQALVLANPLLQGRGEIDLDLVRDWINLAYFEVAGAVEFKVLRRCASLSTIEGVTDYDYPGSFTALIGIQDRTTNSLLIEMTPKRALRLTFDETGYPRYYLQKKGGVRLWPTPDGVYAFFAYYIGAPDPLLLPGDVTTLPATWDKSVLLGAIEMGLRNFNLFDEADKSFTRMMANMKSRLRDEDLTPTSDSPLWVASSMEEIFFNDPQSAERW
jgi:hypothetical protein